MRLLAKIAVVVMFGLGLSACRLWGPAPTPTSGLVFVTITPGQPQVAPTPTFGPLPSLIPMPTITPTSPPQPTSPPPTLLPTFTPLPTLAPGTSTPASPYAVVQSPGGALNVRPGPGVEYGPELGSYSNGARVEIVGKQYAADGELWWAIPFANGPNGQGWLFADYTIAYNVDQVPWINPIIPRPTGIIPPPVPVAIIDGPGGLVTVRAGPGENYPSLGTYRNGRVVDILGKQYSRTNQLWWLIFFPSVPGEEGWVNAEDTISRNTGRVPWVSAPPTPTPTATTTATPTPTSTPTPTPTGPATVPWTITGRVVDAVTLQPVAGASVRAILGSDGAALITVTNSNGDFSMQASARDSGDLGLTISAAGYTDRVITTAPRTPRTYNFPNIELTPTAPPKITWAISGRVTEIGTGNPVTGARVEAVLGADGVRLGTVTDSNGQFALQGEATDSGNLSLTLSADGYQTNNFVSDQTGSRIYTLNDLQLVPLAGSCAYESVINLAEAAALARLQSLSFTNVLTTSVPVTDQTLAGRVISQQPNPPAEGQTSRLNCQTPVTLGIGLGQSQ